MNEELDAEVSGRAPAGDDADTRAALKHMLDIMSGVPPEDRQRLMQSLATFFELAQPTVTGSGQESQSREGVPFSEEMLVSPKEFVFQKHPQSDVERVTVLAYYLTHYRDVPHFKTLDVSKLNTEAAQLKFSNPAYAVENATKYGYLVPASKGNKQLSAIGERFVQALPDRDAAKEVMRSARPRRRAKKNSPTK